MYSDVYSDVIVKKLAKLKKKDLKQYQILRRKMDFILENPEHEYKDLHYTMKGLKRVHIGHFVLVFKVDTINKMISFEDYDHHDKIYI